MIDLLEYFREKLISSVGIPKSYFEGKSYSRRERKNKINKIYG